MVRGKFVLKGLTRGSRFKAPVGFIEEDLRVYAIVDDEGIEEQLNNVLKCHKDQDCGLFDEDGNQVLFGSSTGDIQIDLIDSDDEIAINVYRLIRSWKKKK